MVTKKKGAPSPAPEKDRWDDAREVLIVAGVPVRPPLEEGQSWVGTYLGHVVKESKFGLVRLHLMKTPEGHQGMWGSHALDEGLARAVKGVETRVDGRGGMEVPRGTMRLVRVRQLGTFDASAPIIRDARAEADSIYEELGIKPGAEREMSPETGEFLDDIDQPLDVSTSQVA